MSWMHVNSYSERALRIKARRIWAILSKISDPVDFAEGVPVPDFMKALEGKREASFWTDHTTYHLWTESFDIWVYYDANFRLVEYQVVLPAVKFIIKKKGFCQVLHDGRCVIFTM